MSNEKGLQDAHVKIGTKQTMRTVQTGMASEVYVAEDSDPRLTSKIIALCEQHNVKYTSGHNEKSRQSVRDWSGSAYGRCRKMIGKERFCPRTFKDSPRQKLFICLFMNRLGLWA